MVPSLVAAQRLGEVVLSRTERAVALDVRQRGRRELEVAEATGELVLLVRGHVLAGEHEQRVLEPKLGQLGDGRIARPARTTSRTTAPNVASSGSTRIVPTTWRMPAWYASGSRSRLAERVDGTNIKQPPPSLSSPPYSTRSAWSPLPSRQSVLTRVPESTRVRGAPQGVLPHSGAHQHSGLGAWHDHTPRRLEGFLRARHVAHALGGAEGYRAMSLSGAQSL